MILCFEQPFVDVILLRPSGYLGWPVQGIHAELPEFLECHPRDDIVGQILGPKQVGCRLGLF